MTDISNITAVVLAAGKGTRMKSAKPKVLHEVMYKPMVHYVLDSLKSTSVKNICVVIGHQHEQVTNALKDYQINTVIQTKQLGTGHAVLCAEEACNACKAVLVLCGDTPLVRSATIELMIANHYQEKAVITLMTTLLEDPTGYGRIISNSEGNILEIVEQKDADDSQLQIKEINAGIYLVEKQFLFEALKQITTDNSQGELYLTDIVAIANRLNHKVHKFTHADAVDILGVNSRVELAQAHSELQKRRNRELMLAGVTIYGPDTVFIGPDVTIGQDTIIHPGVQITGDSYIGTNCIICSGAQIHNCNLASETIIGAYANIQDQLFASSTKIDPLARL